MTDILLVARVTVPPRESTAVITTVMLQDMTQEWAACEIDGLILVQDTTLNFGVLGTREQITRMMANIFEAINAHDRQVGTCGSVPA